MKTRELFTACPPFVEDLLEKELISLGAQETKKTKGGVSWTGTMEQSLKACLHSRIASRVLLPLFFSDTLAEKPLYEKSLAFPWESVFSCDKSFRIRYSGKGNQDSRWVSLKIKDGLVDRFRKREGKRPSVSKDNPDLIIDCFLRNDTVQVSFDLSGGGMHRRDLRSSVSRAAIKENTAAALLMRAEWPGNYIGLIDLFCGAGTLIMEAAMIALNIPSGYYRKKWGFFHWKEFNPENWMKMTEEAGTLIMPLGKTALSFKGFDRDPIAIKQARENLSSLGLGERCRLERLDLLKADKTEFPEDGKGLLVANPPYGVRLGKEEELVPLYRKMGCVHREYLPDWSFSYISSSEELSRETANRPDKIYSLMNGGLKCRQLFFHKGGRSDFRRFPPPPQALINRLEKRKKQMTRWARRKNVSSYRVYDADLPEFNAAVDLYEGKWAYIAEYAAPSSIPESVAAKRIATFRRAVGQVFALDEEHVFLKQRRKQKGKEQYVRLGHSSSRQIVEESGCRFYVNFHDYLDTGIFLDHRPVRRMILDKAEGKRFLNLFCYTATASVLAASGGADSIVSVDSSSVYLKWARDNFHLNGLNSSKYHFEEADCREWLKKDKRKFDLVFLDPPTFSNSKSRDDFSVQEDYRELIELTLDHLETGGELLFSTNFRKIKVDWVFLSEKASLLDISAETIGEDFKNNSGIHKCWRIIKK